MASLSVAPPGGQSASSSNGRTRTKSKRAKTEAQRAASLARREAMCLELTGLGIYAASVSVGRCFHANLDAIVELQSMVKVAILPLRECTPARLRGCIESLLRWNEDISGRRETLGWATRLLRRLVPILDWEVVLAHARYADQAQAEEWLARTRDARQEAESDPGV